MSWREIRWIRHSSPAGRKVERLHKIENFTKGLFGKDCQRFAASTSLLK
jgi:hypothetical protein